MRGTGCQVYWIRMASMIQRQCATCHRQGLSGQLATPAMPSQCTCVRGWALYPGAEAVWLASRQGCPKPGPSAKQGVLAHCNWPHSAEEMWACTCGKYRLTVQNLIHEEFFCLPLLLLPHSWHYLSSVVLNSVLSSASYVAPSAT